MPSLFTRIIHGSIPAQVVFSDEHFIAVVDIAPANPGHCLLVPRHETQYLADLPGDTQAALGSALARLIRAVKAATGAPAVNVLINDGPEANQAIAHAHLHVIPRFAGDGALVHPHGTPYADGALAAMADKLRQAAC